MKIEFFHDVICSFCFPMSYRMRQIEEKYPDIEIIHRSFALAWEEEDLKAMFSSRENAKKEILGHWEHANQNDDLHRFNIDGMSKADFPFPTSRNGLLAAKAAKILGGEKAYWQVFDNLQELLFVKSRDIESMDIIKEAVIKAGFNWDEFEVVFNSNETLQEVKADISLARQYGIQGVPFLVVNEKYGVNGAQSLETIEATIEKVAKEMHQPLTMVENGSSCSLDENGTWVCE